LSFIVENKKVRINLTKIITAAGFWLYCTTQMGENFRKLII